MPDTKAWVGVGMTTVAALMLLFVVNQPEQLSSLCGRATVASRGSLSLERLTAGDFIKCHEEPCGEHESYVLVLGAGGLVGRQLRDQLLLDGYNVAQVKGRTQLDLREPGGLDIFDSLNITFAFFLACEVGGAKYLTGPRATMDLYVSNSHLHAAVLPWLEAHDTKFVYVGSQLMESQPNSPYGVMKAHCTILTVT
jgi:hypothetical protein